MCWKQMLDIWTVLLKIPNNNLKGTNIAAAQPPQLVCMGILVWMTLYLQLPLTIDCILHYNFGKVISSCRMLDG